MQIETQDAASQVKLGNVLRERGDLDEAIASYRRALAIEPARSDAHYGLGAAQAAKGELDEAAWSYCSAGNELHDAGLYDDALTTYRSALALRPEHPAAHGGVGLVLAARGKLEEAVASYHRALVADATLAPIYNNLANARKSQGRITEAVANFRRAIELQPANRRIHSNLLYCLQYDPGMTPAALLVEHQAYGARFPALPPMAHGNLREPDKLLNIGYVSPDFHQHPVAFLLLPVLAMHDRAKFAVHCYYGHRAEDSITGVLKRHADVWRSTAGVGDDALVDMIRDDGIDILVDLAGHTATNRLPVFARKPAPIQVSWAGYEGTTGLGAIDYLLTDRFLSPPGSERYATEELVRLPHGYVCWAMPSHAPAVGPLPAKEPGAVAFGCFNNLAKLNPLVIALWGRLLRELPESRLVLKTAELRDPAGRGRILELFAAEGIGADRIDLEGPSPHPDYLQRHNGIDIVLDPFPFSGGVTTVDALWMGVPVVTLPGERFASRHSLSHLSVAGLGELVADGPDDYLRIAKALAHDLPRLAALRASLRERVSASPLRRSREFVRGLEAAFCAMWRAWCERGS